ncbi:MAG: DUF2642 domain-containing protein [Tumebacillaceae bacterium]
MINLDALLGHTVSAELPGKVCKTGYLIDYGDDLFVLYDGRRFFYIPFLHVHLLTKNTAQDILIQPPDDAQIGNQTPKITLRDMLTNATGRFLELRAIGRQPLHGTLTHLLDDYLVFESPVYKTMYISLDHLKWFIPYDSQHLPYATAPIATSSAVDPNSLTKTFAEQVKQLVGQLVVFDAGEMTDKIGTLLHVNQNGMLELITANGEKMYLNMRHVKSVHTP